MNWDEGIYTPGTLEELAENLIDCSCCGERYLQYEDPRNDIRFFETLGYVCRNCFDKLTKCNREDCTGPAVVGGLCRDCFMGDESETMLDILTRNPS